MELWDLYDQDRKPLPPTHPQGRKPHPGEYHTVVEVWTVSSGHKILLILRDPRKEMFPGKRKNTGGSALAGENSRQAAVRELREETGIAAETEELTPLGVFRGTEAFHDVYMLRRDIPIGKR